MDPLDPRLVTPSDLARIIASSTEPAFYTTISETAVRLLDAKVARVWANDPGMGVLRAVGSFGVQREAEDTLLDAITIPHGAGLPGRVAAARAPEFIADAHDDPRWLNPRFIRDLDLHAYAGLPLIAGDTVVGVLSILFESPRVFTEDDKALASSLANHVAITVQVARLYEERRRAELQGAVSSLATAVAHEINSPLTVVTGHLALVDSRGNPEALKHVERARAAAGRLAEVVARLQRITRLEMFRHTASNLPPMLDIWRSSQH